MYFTQEDYKKIENWLHRNSVKDTEFQEALPFTGKEIVTVVQDGHNRKVNIQEFINQLYKHGVEDFLNITNTYRANNITLKEAIRLIPAEARKEGQVITFLNTEGNWEIYQFTGKLNQWNNTTLWNNPFDWEKFIVDSILPDEEDLTKSEPDAKGNSYLSLKDRKYEPDKYSGLGRKILRKRVVEIEDPIYGTQEKNLLLQADFAEDNTVYVVRYDFTLNGQDITLPDNSYIEYEGGSISDGNIIDRAGGLNRVVLNKNIINGKNILTQELINKPNTVYTIQYDYDLNGSEITIPEGCVLDFQGGNLRNGTIIGNNTTIQASLTRIFGLDIELSGNWNVSEAYPEWFGAKGDGENDDTEAIKKVLHLSAVITFTKTYGIVSTINVTKGCIFKGNGALKAIGIIDNIITINSQSKGNYFYINIDGNEKADCGIYADKLVNGIYIKDCELKNFKAQSGHQTEAIRITTNCSRIRIENVYIHDITPTNTGSIGDVDGSVQAILIGNVKDCIISGCTIDNIYGNRDTDCIQIGVIGLGSSNEYIIYESDVIIENCRILNITHRGIKAQCKGITVKNNYFQSNFENETPDALGRKYPYSAINLLGSDKTIIENNIVDFKRTTFIFNFSGNNITISGNHLKGNISEDYVTANAGALDFSYIKNQEELIKNINISNNILTGYYYSIIRIQNFDGLHIKDNILGNSTTQNISCPFIGKNLYIVDNILEAKSGGIVSFESNGWGYIINNVHIINNASYIISDRATEPKLVIRGNNKVGTATNNILTANATSKKYLVVAEYEFRDIAIPSSIGTTANRPTPYRSGGSLNDSDVGMQYYDTDLKRPIFLRDIQYSSQLGYFARWYEVDGVKEGTPRSGTFANKPTVAVNLISTGFRYFCTDKQTIEGATNGIEIIHKGNDVWVDALGRIVE